VALLVLVKREVKAFIKNPAFIIGLIMIFTIYGTIGSIAGRAAQEAVSSLARASMGVVTEESSPLVENLINFLSTSSGTRLTRYSSVEQALRECNVVLLIPRGFTENATARNKTASLTVWVKVDKLSTIGSQIYTSMVSSVESLMERLLPVAISATYNVTIEPQTRLRVNSRVSLFGREFEGEVFNALAGLTYLLPLFMSLVLAINATYAAQIVAMEKEEKAFEMLLAQPVRRRDVVLAKIIGASVASMIYIAVYITAFFAMMFGMIGGFGRSLQQSPSAPTLAPVLGELQGMFSTAFIVIAILTLLIGLILSGALGVIAGSVVSDIRIASTLAAPILFIFIGVGFATMFMGLEPSISSAIIAGLAIVALPYIYVLAALTGNTAIVLYSLATALAFTALVTVVALKLFERDIVVLGLRIPFRRRVEK